MFLATKGRPFHPGQWAITRTPTEAKVRFCCPKCRGMGDLTETHEIASDGTVSPSVVCDCGFHDLVKLEGWCPN